MAESIELFVAKLQEEGVQAGRQAAQKIRAEAELQARQIVEKAEAQATKIVADAEADAKTLAAKTQTQLQLASRDAVLRLRDTLSRAMEAILAQAADQKLTDCEFLAQVLERIVTSYAESDFRSEGPIRINVPDEMRRKLIDWALGRMGHEAADEAGKSIDLKGTLGEAGFEYSVSGATVEFTLSAVVEALSQLVEPALREVLNKAVSDIKE